MKEFKKVQTGIYFLCKDREVLYVGQSVDVAKRIKQHETKDFDSVLMVSVPIELLNEVERYWIEQIKPRLNGCPAKTDSSNKTTKIFSISVPKELVPLIRKEAKHLGRNVSSLLTWLVQQDIKRNPELLTLN